MTAPSLVVHLRVADAATGRPTPVRLRIAGPNGETYFPLGRSPEFALGRNEDIGGRVRIGSKPYCHVDGACEVRLPTGVPLTVEIDKGPEHVPLRESITLGAGQMALRFEVRRWSWLRDEGWRCGDARAHFLAPHDALVEAAAEGLDFVELLATETHVPSQDGHTYPSVANLLAFSGDRPALEREGVRVVVNSLNVHGALGALSLLNCHRVVYPLTFGGSEATDDWSLADWCDQCHRKKGLVVWAYPFRSDRAIGGTGEALVDLILGKVDAIEFAGVDRSIPFLPSWYRLLNAGLRVPLVGASGKDSNRTPLGEVRTYARLGQDVNDDYGTWIESIRAGRTFVTNGPLVRLTVDGREPGEGLDLPPEGKTIRVEATAESGSSFERLEVVADGEVIADAMPSGPLAAARIELDHQATATGWMAVRCWDSRRQRGDASPVFAHTSPVYLDVAGQPSPCREAALPQLREAVQRTREWVERDGRFAVPRRREQMLELCDAALGRSSP